MPFKLKILILYFYALIIFPPEIYDYSLAKFFILSSFISLLFFSELIKSINHIFIILFLSFIFIQIFSFYKANINSISLFIIYVFLIIFLSNYFDKINRLYILQALVILVFILSLYSFYQYFYGYEKAYSFLYPYKSEYLIGKILFYLKNKRITSTFSLPTAYAGFLLSCLPILILATKVLHKSIKIFAIFTLSISILSLILTQSYLTIPALIVLFISLIVSKIIKLNKKIIFSFLIIFILICILIFAERGSFDFNVLKSKTIRMHIGNWLIALKIMREHWLWGVGLGNFQLHYSNYMTETDIETKFAHNLFLQIGAETGIFGFLLFLFALILLLKSIFKLYIHKKVNLESWAYSTAVIIFLIYSCLDISLYFPSIGSFGCLCLSLYLSIIKEENKAKEEVSYSFSFKHILISSVLFSFIIYGCQLFFKEKLLEMSLNELKSRDYEKSERLAVNYYNYFPHDVNSGVILSNIESNQLATEDKLTLQNFIAEKYPYSSRINYIMGVDNYKNGFIYNAFINFSISKLLYPVNPVYNDACNKALSIIKKINDKKPK